MRSISFSVVTGGGEDSSWWHREPETITIFMRQSLEKWTVVKNFVNHFMIINEVEDREMQRL